MRTPDDQEAELLRAALAPPTGSRIPDTHRLELAYAAGMAAGKSHGWKSALTLSVPVLLAGLGLGWGLKSDPVPPERDQFYGRQIPAGELVQKQDGSVWMARSDPGVIEQSGESSTTGMDRPGNPWSVGFIRQHLDELEEGKQ